MNKAWKVIRWVVGMGVLAALLLGGAAMFLLPTIKKSMDESRKKGQGEVVRLEAISPGQLVRTVSAPGFLEATRFVNISARFSAQIVALPFEEGALVTQGDLLVKLDDRDLRAQLASAEAVLSAEEARLEGARATLVNMVIEWERQSSLLASNDVAKSALDQAEADKKRAESTLSAAQAAIAQAKAGISRVREELRYTEIVSPITGTVTKLNAKVGEVVITGTMNNPGTVIMEVADLTEMIVKTEVDETDIADVRIGQQARVHINAYPDEVFTAKVTKIALQRSKARDQSDVFLVETLLDLKGKTLYSGLTASVDIEVETVSDVLLAPSQAVLDRRVEELPMDFKNNPLVDKDKTFARVVYVLEDGKAKAVPVKTGASDLRTTALLAGVESGTKVIIGPYKALITLKHDQRVRDEEVEKKEKEERDAKAAQAKKDRESKQKAEEEKKKNAAAQQKSASAPADQPAAKDGANQQPASTTASAAPAKSDAQPAGGQPASGSGGSGGTNSSSGSTTPASGGGR